MSDTIVLLQSLGAVGHKIQQLEGIDHNATKQLAITPAHIQELVKLQKAGTAEHMWNQLPQLGVSLTDVSQAVAAVMSSAPAARASQFAAWYMTLLNTTGCPVMGLFDRITCAAYLKTVRDAPAACGAKPSKKQRSKNDDMEEDTTTAEEELLFQSKDDAMDVDGDEADDDVVPLKKSQSAAASVDIQHFTSAARNFAALLSTCISFRDQPDLARTTAETFADVTRCVALPQDAAEAAFNVISSLISPAHGGVREMGAVVLRLLGPHCMGQVVGKVSGKGGAGGTGVTAVRTRALAFVSHITEHHAECGEAVAALTRHLMLRCPDKADARNHSVDSITTLCSLLSEQERQQAVVFVARLSKTSKVCHRLMAVEVAYTLLTTLDPVFYQDGGDNAAASNDGEEQQRPVVLNPAVLALRRAGHITANSSLTPVACGVTPLGASTGGNGRTTPTVAVAPWGIVCLAVLIQRGADKAPTVRSKSLGHLASIITTRTNTNASVQEDALAMFCSALIGASKLDLTPQPLAMLTTTTKSILKTGGSVNTPGAIGTTASPAGTEGGVTPMAVDGENVTPGLNTGGGRLPASVGKYCCFAMPAMEDGSPSSTTDLSTLLSTLRRRCADDRGLVRKGAITALQALLVLQATNVTNPWPPASQDIDVLEAAAGDALVSVRKSAAVALFSLLKALPTNATVAKAWISAALPLVRDVEVSVHDSVCDQVDEILTGPAGAAAGNSRDGAPTVPATKALSSLIVPLAALGGSGAAGNACLARALAKLKEKNRLKTRQAVSGLERFLVVIIEGNKESTMAEGVNEKERMVVEESERGAWLLYAELAQHDPAAPSWEFLQQQWTRSCAPTTSSMMISKSSQEQQVSQLLRVIASAAGGFPPEQATALCQQLLAALRGMNLGPAAAAAHVAALSSLAASSGASAKSGGLVNWQAVVYSECEAALGKYVDSFRRGEPIDGYASAQTAMFTAGEVAMLRSGVAPSQRLITLVQALTSPTLATGTALSSFSQQPDTTTIDTTTNGGGASTVEDGTGGGRVGVPAAVQAHAWVALGKLCLVDERLAKKCIPLFVQELSRAGPPAVRNNIMVALADLVVHYTALVDAHVGRLADCIRDSNELVRTQAVALLANLLQKDYVKWRGPLFHRFLLALVDESPKVVALAEFLLGDALATKLPNMAYNRFMETLFVLNDCHVGLHGGSAAAAHAEVLGEERMLSQMGKGSERDAIAFTLKGSSQEMRGKRDALYKALLVRMPPEHKFATAARLCQEVLGAAAEGSLPLEESSCEEVIGDALRVLCSPAIKVSAGKVGGGAVEDGEVDAAAVAGAAKGKLVSQMMRKHLVETVVPIIAELKRVMEAARHPLLSTLMSAAAALLKDYKTELEDILAGNKQLAREILYDIKRAEEAAKEEKKAAAATVVTTTATTTAAMNNSSAKTPGAHKNAAATTSKTPHSGPATGGRRKSVVNGFPAGTSGGTPLAAQVLMEGGVGSMSSPLPGPRKTPGSAPAINGAVGSGAVPSSNQQQPMSVGDGGFGSVERVASGSTPGGASPMIVVPVAGGNVSGGAGRFGGAGMMKTPGGELSGGRRRARFASGQRAAVGRGTTNGMGVSRLARASGPGTVPGSAGGGGGLQEDNAMLTSPNNADGGSGSMQTVPPPTVPRLRKTPGSAAAPSSWDNDDDVGMVDEDEEVNHVELPFAVPGTAEKKWNVSAAVVATVDDDANDVEMMGVEEEEKEVGEVENEEKGRSKRPQRKRKA